jgi:hypothetical protein
VTTTLVVLGTRNIDGRRYEHGEELPPDLLTRETVDQWLDRKWLAEYYTSYRRSVYQLFAPFSGCKESESLTKAELDQFALPT